jgi:hypothetical protein
MGKSRGGKIGCQLIQTVIHPSSSLGAQQKRPVSTQKAGIAARQMKTTHYVVNLQSRTICQ